MKDVIAIAACENTFGIGYKNSLPWPRIKEDMDFFKKETTDHVVVMGRKTWDSLNHKKLPNRTNIVISRRTPEGSPDLVTDLTGLPLIEHIRSSSDKKIFIIGGSTIYEQMIDYCDQVYLSIIKGFYDADVYFPINKLNSFKRDYFKNSTCDLMITKWSRL